MFKMSNGKNNNYYKEMELIKRVNLDYINLRNSKKYKYGLVMMTILDDLKTIHIKKLFLDINRWIKGKKSKSIKTVYDSVSVKNIESNYFFDKRIAIYTSIYGCYDSVFEPNCLPDNCDYFIFTDSEIPKDSNWKKIDTGEKLNNYNNVEKNRYVKMHPHDFFSEYDYSIYVDGNVEIFTDLTEYVNLLGEGILATHMHHLRKCVYEELKATYKSRKINKNDYNMHKEFLEKSGMPHDYGLLQCNVIVRKHNDPLCIKIMNEWWDEFRNYSKRDQISLPHVLYNNKISVDKVGILGSNVYLNPSFRIHNHE